MDIFEISVALFPFYVFRSFFSVLNLAVLVSVKVSPLEETGCKRRVLLVLGTEHLSTKWEFYIDPL